MAEVRPVTASPAASHRRLPSWHQLHEGLSTVLGTTPGDLRVLSRRPNPYASTFPSEIVAVQTSRSEELLLLCKYGDTVVPSFGHRGGVQYEARVLRQVIQPLGIRVPHCHGTWSVSAEGPICLVTEYLPSATHLNKTATSPAKAAAWLGLLHARNEPTVQAPFLIRHDAQYLNGWARRAAAHLAATGQQGPWLEASLALYADLVRECEPDCIVHGEFYPANILVDRGTILPIDWESAAISCGAVDLASLTEGWPPGVQGHCEAAYVRVRWGGQAPADFPRQQLLARLYWYWRWLGQDATWIPKMQMHVDRLRALGERLRDGDR